MTHEKPTPAPVEVTALKPCPFCGSSDVCVQGGEYVCCGQCLADGPYFADDIDRTPEAIAAWNTRHSAPAGEVEPVAWLYEWRHVESTEWSSSVAKVRPSTPFHGIEIRNNRPLYTHPAPPAGEVVATYRHVKRGTTYQVVGAAELQATAYNVHEGDKLTIYRGQDGKLWARHEDEFHDGRFEQVEGTHPAPPADLMEALKRLLEEYVSNIDSHRLGGFYLDPEKEECVVEARAALAKHGGA